MKRHPSLVPLSRDHHRALVLVRALRRGELTCESALAELAPHFGVEEAELVGRARAKGGEVEAAAERVFADHEAMRRELSPTRLADLLEGHVRFEERTFFPALEAALAEDLVRLRASLWSAPAVAITGFHCDEEGAWVADLACGHAQHVRHQPPLSSAPWVTTEAGRLSQIGTKRSCRSCRMPKLPLDVVEYRRTAEFDESSLPRALSQSHTLKAETWGEIVVLAGRVRYVLEEDGDFTVVLRPGAPGVIAPEAPHHVELEAGARMLVRFLRRP